MGGGETGARTGIKPGGSLNVVSVAESVSCGETDVRGPKEDSDSQVCRLER